MLPKYGLLSSTLDIDLILKLQWRSSITKCSGQGTFDRKPDDRLTSDALI